MTKARYKVVADGNRSFEGEMNVPSWYFDDGDQLVVGSPPPEDDSLMLLLNSLEVKKEDVFYPPSKIFSCQYEKTLGKEGLRKSYLFCLIHVVS